LAEALALSFSPRYLGLEPTRAKNRIRCVCITAGIEGESKMVAASINKHEARRHAPDPARIALSKFFTIEQVALQLEVSIRTVRRWIASGLLIAHRFGGVVRIAEHDLRAFLAQHRAG